MLLTSIIGDSISTFEGFHPPGYAVFYNREMQSANGLTSVYDTWWAKVNQALHAYLCVNNSYSGSRVTGADFPAASSTERISLLRTSDYSPDVILIYIGYNDFGYGVKIGRKQTNPFHKRDLSLFEDAYAYMIVQIKEQYPMAKVICGTLLRTRIRGKEKWLFPEAFAGVEFEEYNNAIRRICNRKKVFLADLASQKVAYETLDGSHPTADGHQTIASAWIKSLMESGCFPPSSESDYSAGYVKG